MLDRASAKTQETSKFFKKLKKIKTAELDNLFLERHIRYSSEIDCLDCANCCRGTGPLIKERDIKRLSKSLSMKPGEFTDTYLQVDEEGDMIFREMPCPFIAGNNYCIVYEDRPTACREYPHTDRQKIAKYLGPTLKNYSICPIVYLVIEDLKKTIP
nr:YkgJ family cysteine cluster protein [Spirochaeta isovalerica]